MGENLPKNLAKQWAEFCSKPGYVMNTIGKTIFDDYHQQIKLLQTANSNEFLNLFARKVQLVDVLKVTKPAALLVDASFIEGLCCTNLSVKGFSAI